VKHCQEVVEQRVKQPAESSRALSGNGGAAASEKADAPSSKKDDAILIAELVRALNSLSNAKAKGKEFQW
jgi:hypothetical protein